MHCPGEWHAAHFRQTPHTQVVDLNLVTRPRGSLCSVSGQREHTSRDAQPKRSRARSASTITGLGFGPRRTRSTYPSRFRWWYLFWARFLAAMPFGDFWYFRISSYQFTL